MKKTDPEICVIQWVDKDIELVWKVITERRHLTNWFFEMIPDFRAEVGFKTQFLVQVEDRKFTHLWEITDVIEKEKITYNWKYAEYDGDSLVHFELQPKDGGTSIQLSLEILEDFPQNVPEFKLESGRAGWNYFIGDQLPKYLDSL